MSAQNVREAIERLSLGILADPAKARGKNAPATARLAEGLRCELTGPYNERLVTDMPAALGGAASGPNPGWLLRGALASCTATVIAMRAAKLGVARHGPVRMKVKIGAPAASSDVLREIVAWADAHSPVTCTIRQAPACSLDVEVV